MTDRESLLNDAAIQRFIRDTGGTAKADGYLVCCPVVPDYDKR